jgi:hypothetical protein
MQGRTTRLILRLSTVLNGVQAEKEAQALVPSAIDSESPRRII